jgi:EAL domain-containing protein (putative c-di-GMP-specific phosphodiesterase class I)/GGDEF domain-containing protein
MALQILKRLFNRNTDRVTGLPDRAEFLRQCQNTLDKLNVEGGSLVLLRLAGLAQRNRLGGWEATDAWLNQAAEVLLSNTLGLKGVLVGRLSGSDFGVLFPQEADENTVVWANQLLQDLRRRVSPLSPETQTTAWIGLGRFKREDALAAIFSKVDGALAAAQAQGRDAISVADSDSVPGLPQSSAEWLAVFDAAVESNALELHRQTVVGPSKAILFDDVTLGIYNDDVDSAIDADQWRPVAERLQYTSNLDLAFTEKALATLEDAMQRKTPLVAMALHLNLNLSAASLLDESFMPRLLALLDKHESVAKHLLFAMNEAPALRQGKAFEAFCLALQARGIRVGVSSAGYQLAELSPLVSKGLRFLTFSSGDAAWLAGLCQFAHVLGLQVFAQDVQFASALEQMWQRGFDGASGPGINNS